MALKTFHRGLRDMKIAVWNSEGSYGTAYDVLGAREMTATFTVETEELRGDDVVLDRYTKIVSVMFNIAHAAVDLQLAEYLMGGQLSSNGSYERLVIGQDDDVPYVSVAGRIVGSGGTADLHIWAPKAKLAGDLQMQAQLDTYMIPTAQFQAVHEGATNGMYVMHKFAAATALEIPLRFTTGGL